MTRLTILAPILCGVFACAEQPDLLTVDISGQNERQTVIAAGTSLLATTYIKYRPGPEKQSIVSTRFAASHRR
jgi:hypothetical protein